MKNIEADVWLNLSATTRVYYQSKKDVRLIDLKRMVLSINPDVIYLNSMFSKHFVIDYLLIRLFEKCDSKVILTPRGMLKQSALKKKWFKKWTYLRFARFFGLYNDIQFNASNEEEKIEILRVFPNARVTIIANIPPPIHSSPPILEKLPNHVKLCFIARIHSIKNLHFLLEVLKGVKINIILSVIGNAEDTKYTAICKQIALTLPLNIKVVFLGGLAHDEVNDSLVSIIFSSSPPSAKTTVMPSSKPYPSDAPSSFQIRLHGRTYMSTTPVGSYRYQINKPGSMR
ncbi:MAG: hypothetical protein IPG82_07640 [Saprospiraceae bacterium]|nr:hypothetical protein [Saprospiraceae bacterium]